ncbi:transposase IS421 [Mesorhizobium sp. LSJC285A00]|nr:transposase IS421 [Mesorhizobium sp. LSJC285A00]
MAGCNGLWRMHCAFELEREQFDFIEITDQSEAELIDRVPVVAGEIRIGDRAYLQAERIAKVMAQGGPADTVLKLYRMRWRIELAFKRLKSLIGLRSPPAKDPRIAKPWILAHFIALVTEPLSQELGVSPP